MSLRTLRISKQELLQIRKIYESVMSYACYGLFFREGQVFGENIAAIAMESAKGDREKYFEVVSNLLAGRGWCEKAEFYPEKAVIKGSIEVEEGQAAPSCHILKGIIKKIYEEADGERYSCEETECESKGDEHCVFVVKKKGV